jgi:hypothetical protein
MHVPNVGKRPQNSFDPVPASGNRVDKDVSHGRGVTLPRIRAGESSKGYLGRLAATNSSLCLATLLTQLKHVSSSEAAIEDPGMNAVMAALTEVEPSAFLAQHTLLPFQKCVVPPKLLVPFTHVTAQRARAAYNFPANIPGALMFLCHVCVATEIEATGDSIWHRSHQLPGVVVCLRHKVGLHSVAPTTLLKYPHQILSNAVAINDAIVQDALANAFICRYMRLCELFAARTKPYTTVQLTTIIGQQVLKIDQGSAKKPVRLARYIQQYLHGPWITEFFPQLHRVRGASNLSSFDQAGTRVDLAYPTPYYCLALAVLFDTFEEVAQSLAEVTTVPSAAGHRQATTQRPFAIDQNGWEKAMGGAARSAGLTFNDAIVAALIDFSNGSRIEDAATKHNVAIDQVVEHIRLILQNQIHLPGLKRER